MDIDEFFSEEFSEHRSVLLATELVLKQTFIGLLEACVTALRAGGKILIFGNGGSAADAQHLATELTIRYKKNRRPIAALALTTDSSALTACGNDLGFEHIFARQIEALGRPEDISLGISTSGQSANVLFGLRQARKMGLVTAALTGTNGSGLTAMVDHVLIVPSTTVSRIQEMHILLGHMLCGAIEIKLEQVS